MAKNSIQSMLLQRSTKSSLTEGNSFVALLTPLLYLFILKHHPTRREGRRGWSSQITNVLQGMSASFLFFLVVAITLFCFLSCYSLQNGMHGGWVYFQYNSDSKDNFKNQDLSVNCKTNLYTN